MSGPTVLFYRQQDPQTNLQNQTPRGHRLNQAFGTVAEEEEVV